MGKHKFDRSKRTENMVAKAVYEGKPSDDIENSVSVRERYQNDNHGKSQDVMKEQMDQALKNRYKKKKGPGPARPPCMGKSDFPTIHSLENFVYEDVLNLKRYQTAFTGEQYKLILRRVYSTFYHNAIRMFPGRGVLASKDMSAELRDKYGKVNRAYYRNCENIPLPGSKSSMYKMLDYVVVHSKNKQTGTTQELSRFLIELAKETRLCDIGVDVLERVTRVDRPRQERSHDKVRSQLNGPNGEVTFTDGINGLCNVFNVLPINEFSTLRCDVWLGHTWYHCHLNIFEIRKYSETDLAITTKWTYRKFQGDMVSTHEQTQIFDIRRLTAMIRDPAPNNCDQPVLLTPSDDLISIWLNNFTLESNLFWFMNTKAIGFRLAGHSPEILFDTDESTTHTNVAFLNGSHGEFTNGDDMNVQQQNNAHRRVARNHQNQRRVNGGRNAAPAQQAGPQGANVPPAQANVALANAQPLPVAPPAKVKLYIVAGPMERAIHHWVFKEIGFFDTLRCPQDPATICVAGTQVDNIIDTSFRGSVVTQAGKGSRDYVRSVFMNQKLPRMEVNGSKIDAKTYKIFTPLLGDLKKTFANVKATSHGLEACLSLGRRKYQCEEFSSNGLPDFYLVDTCTYYFLVCQKDLRSVLCSKGVNSLLGVIRPGELDYATVRAYSSLNVDVRDSEPVRIQSIECPLASTFFFHGYADIQCKGGAVLNELPVDILDLNGNVVGTRFQVTPTFPTQQINGKWYSTDLCRILGLDVNPFVQYDNSGANMTKAMNRLLKQRDGDEFYTSNQMNIIGDELYEFATGHLGEFESDLLRALRVRAKYKFQTPEEGFVCADSSIKPLFAYTKSEDIIPEGYCVIGNPGAGRNHVECSRPRYNEDRTTFEVNTFGTPLSDAVRNSACVNMRAIFKQYKQTCDPGHIRATLDTLYSSSHWAYYKGYDAYLTYLEPFWSRTNNAEIPHVKKALRKAYVDGVLLHDDADIMVKRLNACVKNEMAKEGKAPRLFVSYDAGCMYANELPEMIKMGFDGVKTMELPGLTVLLNVIAKPKSDTFENLFALIRDSIRMSNTLLVTIYSDDTVYSGSIGSYNFCFNVDISACDASNHYPIFYMTGKLLGLYHEKRAIGLVKQCTLPITLENPDNKDEQFIINMHSAFEGSGTTLTTILNHLASVLDAIGTASVLSEAIQELRPPTNDESMSRCINLGAYLAGHKVSVQTCQKQGEVVFEKVQFLKRSMFLTNKGTWTYAENIGSTLRGFGRIEGDLTCIQVGMSGEAFNALSWEERMDTFLSGVVQGKKHEPSNPILSALRERFSQDIVLHLPNFSHPVSERESETIAYESFVRRYEVTETELGELVEVLKLLKSGDRIVSRCASVFYSVDYDVDVIAEL